MIGFDLSYAIQYFPKIAAYLPVTLLIVAVSAVGGLSLGALMAIARIERVPVLREISAVLVSFIRGTPIYIQLFVIYYGLPMLLLLVGIDIMRSSKMLFVLVAYSINVAGFASEMIRSAVLAVPKNQWDAALSVGHSKRQTYTRVIIPQAVVIAIPTAGSLVTSMIADTALASSLGVIDALARARALGEHNMRLLEAFIDAAVIFMILAFIFERFFIYLQKRYGAQQKK
jgi:L-cystine transport system permease protein